VWRVIGVDYNEREQALPLAASWAWLRPAWAVDQRSAPGGHAGLRELAGHEELEKTIRAEVIQKAGSAGDQDSPNRQATMATLVAKRTKLLDLHYQDRIGAEAFGEKGVRLTRQIERLRSEEAELETEHARRDERAERLRRGCRAASAGCRGGRVGGWYGPQTDGCWLRS
jgi:hypothetical protein